MARRKPTNPWPTNPWAIRPAAMPSMPTMPSLGIGMDDEPEMPARRRQAAEDIELTPEEENKYLQGALSTVEYVGGAIGKGGQALRGVATGKPAALLNLIPFYDTARYWTGGEDSPLPEAPKTEGREVLEHYGVLGKNKPGFDWGDVAGFGVELIDPIMLTGFGGLSKAGLAAKAARTAKAADLIGDTAKLGKSEALKKAMSFARKELAEAPDELSKIAPTFGNQLRSGERALLNLQVPFTKTPFASFGTGKAAGAVGDVLQYNPAMRMLRGLFSPQPGVGGQFTRAAQQAADETAALMRPYADAVVNSAPAIHETSAAWTKSFQEIAKSLGKQGDEQGARELDSLIRSIKGDLKEGTIVDIVGRKLGMTPGTPEWETFLAKAADHKDLWYQLKQIQRESSNKIHGLWKDYGGKVGVWQNEFEEYAARKASPIVGKKYNPARERKQWLNELIQSEMSANLLSRNATLIGRAPGAAAEMSKADHISAMQKAILDKAAQYRAVGTPQAATKAAALEEAAKSTSRFRLQTAYAQELIGDITDDLVRYDLLTPEKQAEYMAKLTQTGEQIIKRGGKVFGTPKKLSSPLQKIVHGLARLPKEIVDTGLFPYPEVGVWRDYTLHAMDKVYALRTMHNFLRQPGVLLKDADDKSVSLLQLWEDAGKGGLNLDKQGLTKFLKDTPEMAARYGSPDDPATLAKMYVSPAAARTLKAFKGMHDDVAPSEFGKMIDSFTAPFKVWWTTRLGFHTRNAGGGWYQSYADGHVGAGELTKSYGRLIRWSLTGKGDPSYIDEFARLGGFQDNMLTDITGIRDMATDVASYGDIKGNMKSALMAAKNREPGWWNPLAVGRSESDSVFWRGNNVISRGQAAMHRWVEFLNRGAYYETLRRKGWTPADALRAVERTQFNYAKGSPYTKTVFNRLVPFWGWTVNNIPLQLERIMSRPMGSPTGMALKGMSAISGGDEYVPEWLREGLGVPLPEALGGGTPDQRSYFKQVGIPLEDINKFVFKSSGTPDVQRTLEKFAGQMHPLIRMPMEWITGKQVWSGRKLSELQPRTPWPTIDRLLEYTPFSTQIGEFDRAFDERKPYWQRALNLATGAKIGTYDAERSKQYALQRAMQEDLEAEGHKVGSFTLPYLRPKYSGTPEGEAIQEQLDTLKKVSARIRRMNKEREAKGK